MRRSYARRRLQTFRRICVFFGSLALSAAFISLAVFRGSHRQSKQFAITAGEQILVNGRTSNPDGKAAKIDEDSSTASGERSSKLLERLRAHADRNAKWLQQTATPTVSPPVFPEKAFADSEQNHIEERIKSGISDHQDSSMKTGAVVILSRNCGVKSSVRGNLGPPNVITQSNSDDWLADRWQAAKDMSGSPIEGKHWVMVDLGDIRTIHYLRIDFETAYSRELDVEFKKNPHDQWFGGDISAVIDCNHPGLTKCRPVLPTMSYVGAEKHLPFQVGFATPVVARFLRLNILKPSTTFGTSIWELQVVGQILPGQDQLCI